jgi:ComF family protein
LEGTRCAFCGEKLSQQHFETNAPALCSICRRAAPRFRKAVAYGAYEGTLRDLLHLFKYRGVRSAAPLLCRLMSRAVDEAAIHGPLLVVPVPLAAGKKRARGFNQAEQIAARFARPATARSIQLDTHVLARTRETVSQTGLTRQQRQANLRGAFTVMAPEVLRGRTILLVDDVMTTGATAGECSRVLLRAGAKQVFVATVARAIRESENVLAQAAGALSGGTTGHA